MGQINVIPPHITHPEKEFRTIVLPHPLPTEWNHFLEQNSWRIIDEFEQQCEELKKIAHFSKNPVNEREIPSNYILYPWRKTAVRLLTKEDFITVRTSRNHYKISPAEQDLLGQKTIGVVGLSVGQSVALTIAMERSVGRLKLADFDTLDLSNLNRLRASVLSLAEPKSHIVAREIAELDPYLEVELFESGLTKENAKDFFDGNHPLDLVVEECDSLEIKMLVREEAQKRALPVLMDTSDRGMLDVERFDRNPDYPLLHGLVDGISSDSISKMSPPERLSKIFALAGIDKGSSRLKYSITQLGNTIPTWPQLASSVTYGGGLTADIARRILLNEPIPSGRYFLSPYEQLMGVNDKETDSSTFSEKSWLMNTLLPLLPKGHILSDFINGYLSEELVSEKEIENLTEINGQLISPLLLESSLPNARDLWRIFSSYFKNLVSGTSKEWMLCIYETVEHFNDEFFHENPNPFVGFKIFDSISHWEWKIDIEELGIERWGRYCRRPSQDLSINWFVLVGEYLCNGKCRLEEGKIPLINPIEII